MPWKLKKISGKWHCVNAETGKDAGASDSLSMAKAHLRALYSNSPEARASEPFESDVVKARAAELVSAVGYADDFSKSNNALEAEASGKFPATHIASKLGVSAKFIKEHAPNSGEWHHTSKFYNTTPYYDHDTVKEWLESDEGKAAHEEFKAKQAEAEKAGHRVMENASIKYLEWGGTRNHPVAHEVEEHGVHIHQKPGASMVTITRGDGSQFKKKLETRGFEIKDSKGKHFYADHVFKHESIPGSPHSGKGNWGHGGPGEPGGPGTAKASDPMTPKLTDILKAKDESQISLDDLRQQVRTLASEDSRFTKQPADPAIPCCGCYCDNILLKDGQFSAILCCGDSKMWEVGLSVENGEVTELLDDAKEVKIQRKYVAASEPFKFNGENVLSASGAIVPVEVEEFELVYCKDAGNQLPAEKKWEFGKPVEFMWAPGGKTQITAGCAGRSLRLWVIGDKKGANDVQASFATAVASSPRRPPYGCIEHQEKERAIEPKQFVWKESPEPGIYCSAIPTKLGETNVNGRMQTSFSPCFRHDARFSTAVCIECGEGATVCKCDGTLEFPEGVRGSESNPAHIVGVFEKSVGSLTNWPAFKDILPVTAKEPEVTRASGTSEGVKKSWETRERGRLVNSGMGGFLNPPDHPEHKWHVQTDLSKREWNRGGMSLSHAATREHLHPDTRNEARAKLKEWEKTKKPLEHSETQDWIRQTHGYFKGMFRNPAAGEKEWHDSEMLHHPGRDPVQEHQDSAAVHHIRQYYPDYKPKKEHVEEAYWGEKPSKAAEPTKPATQKIYAGVEIISKSPKRIYDGVVVNGQPAGRK